MPASEPSVPTDPSAPPHPTASDDEAPSRWERMPTALRFLIMGLVTLAALFAVRVVPDLLFEEDSPWQWVYLGLAAALLGLLLVSVVRRARRRVGGADQMRLLRQALKDGEVPPQANREAWRTQLEKSQRGGREAVWWHVITSLVPAILLAGLLVVVAVTSDAPTAVRVALPLVGLLVVALSVFTVVMQRRNHERSTALLAQL